MRIFQLLPLLAVGCHNWSTIKVPEGMPRSYVERAVEHAIEARDPNDWRRDGGKAETDPHKHGRIIHTKDLPVPEARRDRGLFRIIQTPPHYSMTCGAWNGAWGFPLYWVHHEVELFHDRVKIKNYGYGWNIWGLSTPTGFATMLLPFSNSGGLHEAIRDELKAAEYQWKNAPQYTSK